MTLNIQNMIRALYIHGYNGSGYTGEAIEKIAKAQGIDIKVFTEKFNKNPTEILKKVKTLIRTKDINLLIASSYGAFIALQITNLFKIVINPCLFPSIEIPKLDSSFRFIDECKKLEKNQFSIIDSEAKSLTFGLFASNDELFSYKSTFAQYYKHVFNMGGGHKISESNIKNVLIPVLSDFVLPQMSKLYKMQNSHLFEHFITSIGDKRKEYADVVYSILLKSYANIGGMYGCNSVEDLLSDTDLWKLVRKNNEIVAVVCYSRKRGGRKLVYCGQNGTDIGKNALYKILEEDIKILDRNAWEEVSGAMEHILLKKGAVPLPAKYVEKLMPDKEILSYDNDGIHYTRLIGNIKVTKCLFGNI